MKSKAEIISIVLFLSAFIMLVSCGQKKDKVEKILEDGVEVVVNHIEPYKITREPSTFTLEEELVIDTERDDILDAGMGTAGEFDVDSEGNIYIVSFKNIKNFIYKFDSKGNLVTSFGRMGQGPKELQWPISPAINDRDEMAIYDYPNKLAIFNKNGGLVKEEHLNFRSYWMELLENGKYLVWRLKREKVTTEYFPRVLSLYDSRFNEIKELDVYKSPNQQNRLTPYFMWRISNGHIYIANEERGYEIWVYDLEGNLARKIRKDYRPVTASEEIKKLILGPSYGPLDFKDYFPRPLPPLSSFFTDDEGCLFVMTYEEGERPGEYLCDIFNPEGIFVGRKSLHLVWAQLYFGPKYTMVKKNHLYCHREKESGYMELVVYKMNWE